MQCDYLLPLATASRQLAPLEGTSKGPREATSCVSAESNLHRSVDGFYGFDLGELTSLSGRTALPSLEETAFAVKAMHHFETVTSATMSSYLGHEILRHKVLSMVSSSPFLFHAVLGISAAHLQHLLPAHINPLQNQEHRLAETRHWQQALKLFQIELANPQMFGMHNMDQLLTTCMLLTVHTLSLPGDGKYQSFVDLPRAETASALGWISSQRGFRALFAELGHFLQNSVWLPVFLHAVDYTRAPTQNGLDVDRVSDLLDQLCGITATTLSGENVYVDPKSKLVQQLRVEPSVGTFHQLITFPGQLETAFVQLLEAKDPAALLILSHWLAHISKVGFWWIKPRAELECRAICSNLASSDDPRILELLNYPASVAFNSPSHL